MSDQADAIADVLDGFVPISPEHPTARSLQREVAKQVRPAPDRPAVGIGDMLAEIIERLDRIEARLEER